MAVLKVAIVCVLLAGLVGGEDSKTMDVPCWRGDKCNSCNDGYTGSQNGVKVCCAECYKTGFTMIGGSVCTCNMPPPTGRGATTVTLMPGVLVAAFLVSSAWKAFTY